MGWRGNLLRGFLATRGELIAGLSGADARRDLQLVRATRAQVPLLVQDAAALTILACARAAASLGGSMAEAGVYRGGTARLMCEIKGTAALHLFDVFETLQANALSADSETSQEVRGHFGSFHARQSDVAELLAPYSGVQIHAGYFPDSARPLENERFSFVHLDLDLERGTSDALEFFYPRLLPGGFLIGDDYNSDGVRRAFRQYFGGYPGRVIGLPWAQALAVKA
ncbi:MAG: TylF/MycF/NovP-related O-methyltransferase [Longimicrobiales bacterium]